MNYTGIYQKMMDYSINKVQNLIVIFIWIILKLKF